MGKTAVCNKVLPSQMEFDSHTHTVALEKAPTQPPMVVLKTEAQSEYVHVAHTFFARLAPICMLSRCLLTKFLHRSSVGSLLRVRCWLGNLFFFFLHSTLSCTIQQGNCFQEEREREDFFLCECVCVRFSFFPPPFQKKNSSHFTSSCKAH